MNIINPKSIRKQILKSLRISLRYSRGELEEALRSCYRERINRIKDEINKKNKDIKNIDKNIEILVSLIINNDLLKKILYDDDKKNMRIALYIDVEENHYNKTLTIQGVHLYNSKKEQLCDIFFNYDRLNGCFLSNFCSLNTKSKFYFGLSSLSFYDKNKDFEYFNFGKQKTVNFYKNKIMTQNTKKQIEKTVKILKGMDRNFGYSNTQSFFLNFNIISELNRVKDATKIKFMGTRIKPKSLNSIKGHLKKFKRYYNCIGIDTEEKLKNTFIIIRQIRKYLNKQGVYFKFSMDVMRSKKIKVYFNEYFVDDKVYVSIDPEKNLKDFLKSEVVFKSDGKIKDFTINIVEYLKNKNEIDTLIKLMQY